MMIVDLKRLFATLGDATSMLSMGFALPHCQKSSPLHTLMLLIFLAIPYFKAKKQTK